MKALTQALCSRTGLSRDARLALSNCSRPSKRTFELRPSSTIASCARYLSYNDSGLDRQPVRPWLHAKRAFFQPRKTQSRHESTKTTDSTHHQATEDVHNQAGLSGQSTSSITSGILSAGSQYPNSNHPQAEDTSSSTGKVTNNIARTADNIYTYLSRLLHQLDTLTGTDYTPIKHLRTSIQSQEAYVSSLRAELASCRSDYSSRVSAQGAHHKEVVGLLERKNSWSSSDLESYMSLIRSEHLDEAAVVETRRKVEDSEQRLEEARQALEKMERTRYHEEQVWSDTIRRQGTRVTVVLMGFNLLVLVASVALLEPHRRRVVVREVTQEIRRLAEEKRVAEPNAAETGRDSSTGIAEERPPVAAESLLAIEDPSSASMPHHETQADFSPLKDYFANRQPSTLLQTLVDPALFRVLALQVRLYIADLFAYRTVQRQEVTTGFMSGMGAGLFGSVIAWWVLVRWLRR